MTNIYISLNFANTIYIARDAEVTSIEKSADQICRFLVNMFFRTYYWEEGRDMMLEMRVVCFGVRFSEDLNDITIINVITWAYYMK